MQLRFVVTYRRFRTVYRHHFSRAKQSSIVYITYISTGSVIG